MHFNNESAFGENSTYVYDWSGTGNNGTVYGGTIPNELAKFGKSFNYSASDDYITVDDHASIKNMDEMTVAVWIYPYNTDGVGSDTQTIVQKDNLNNGNERPWILGWWSNNNPVFGMTNSSNGFVKAVSSVDANQDSWNHMVGRLNSTHLTIFLNGFERGSVPRTNLDATSNTDPVTLGRLSYTDAWPFLGLIDEVAIWNRSLSEAEIEALYNYSKTKFYPVFQNETLGDGNYVWNVLAYDNATSSQSDWDSNRSLLVDGSAPVINSKGVNVSSVSPGAGVCINASVTESLSSVDAVWATVTQSNGSVFNTSEFSDTGDCAGAGGDGWYSVNVSVGDVGGTFYYNVTYVNNSVGVVGSNSSAVNITVNTVDDAPNVSLSSPDDASFDADGNVIFNCTVTDDNSIGNITLYGNWSGSWIANKTVDFGSNGEHWDTGDLGNTYAVTFADLDNDGKKNDVIVASYDSGLPENYIRAYWPNGSVRWDESPDKKSAGFVRAVHAMDVDGDGFDNDIIVEFSSGLFAVYNESGNNVSESPYPQNWMVTMGEADLDGNGVYDLVTIGREFTGEVRAYNTTDNGSSWNNVWNKTGMTYAMAEIEGFDADSDNKTDEMLLVGFAEIYCVEARNGSVIWSNTSTEIPSLASAAAAVLDLNHDGNRNEVVYSAGYFAPYNLYAVEGDTGDVIWTSDIPMHSSAQYNRELIPADLDNDGWIDDFVVSNYYIHGVNNDSTVLWNFTTPTAYIYSVAVGDLTGDDEVEIVAGGDQGIVWVLNRTGALLWSKDLGQGDIGTALGKGEAISIADFNDDGINDFAVATLNGFVNVFSLVTSNVTVSFNVTGISDGTHSWNCLAYDNNSQSDWGDTNNTLTVDSTAPVINSKGVNVSSVSPGAGVCINASVTESLSSVDAVWATVTQSNGSVFNTSEFSDTGDCAGVGSDGWYSVNVNVGDVGGTFYYNVTYVNNSLGLLGSNSSVVSISVDAAPNTTLVTPANGAGLTSTTVRFISNVTDGNNVVNATLYTNETSWSAKETRWNGEIAYNDTGLVFLAHFNNESLFGENDTYVYDWSGTGNNGTSYVNNSDGSVRGPNATGKFGGSFRFDGNDYINAGKDASLNVGGGNFTFAAWAKLYSNSSDSEIVVKGDLGQAIDLRYDFDEDSWQFTVSAGGWQYAKYLQESPVINTWYHVVGIRNGSTIKVYVNGVEGNTVDTVGTVANLVTYNLVIGRIGDTADRYFNGTIDEVAVWNRSLSASEIMALYNYTKTKFYPVFQNETLSEADYVWNVLAYDNNSQSDWDTNNSFTVLDTINPSISNLAINTSLVKNQSFAKLNASITDNIGAINRATFTVNNSVAAANYTAIDNYPEFYYNYQCNASATIQWSHAYANDSAGNNDSNLNFGLNFVCDADRPVINNDGSNTTSVVVGSKACLSINVTDNLVVDASSVIAQVYNTSDWLNLSMSNASSNCGSAGGSVFTVELTLNAGGTWNYSKVYASDTAGNSQSYDFNDRTISAGELVTPTNPASYISVDRDGVNASVADSALLVAKLSNGTSGVTVTFKANLTDPIIADQTNLTLDTAVTNATGYASITWSGNDSLGEMYAGNYTWWPEATGYNLNGTKIIYLYGGMNLTFRYTTTDPNTNYTVGNTITFDTLLDSKGPESRGQLNSTYSGNVSLILTNPLGSNTTLVLIDPGPDDAPRRGTAASKKGEGTSKNEVKLVVEEKLAVVEDRRAQVEASSTNDYYAPDGSIGGTWAQVADADQAPDDTPDTDDIDNAKELFTYGFSGWPAGVTVNDVWLMLRWQISATGDDDLELKYKLTSGGTWLDLDGTTFASDDAGVFTANRSVGAYATQAYKITSGLSLANLDDLYLGVNADKDAGGDNDNADIDAIWLRLNYTVPDASPNVSSLDYPGDGISLEPGLVDFNFSASDDSKISNCSLWANFSGTWARNVTVLNPTNNSEVNFTVNVSLGNYIWNVQCFDNATTPQGDWYDSNYSVIVSWFKPTVLDVSVVPSAGVNGTVLNISANVTDVYGLGVVKALLEYPNGTNFINVTLDNSSGGTIYYNETYVIDTNEVWGNFTVTVWTNNSKNVINQSESVQFIPYWNVSQNKSITVDGDATDWSNMANLTDLLGDSLEYNGFVQVATGYRHGCAIRFNGSAYCWGLSGEGQVGYGGISTQGLPVAVNIVNNNFSLISVGKYHSCGVHVNGSAYCWGLSGEGQVGYGGIESQLTPIAVNIAVNNFSDIDAGGDHTCALHVNGSAYCWGEGLYGKLGNGDEGNRTVPTQVNYAPNNWTTISGGASQHTCALAVNGSAYCWGRGLYGVLGDGGTVQQNTPVAVSIGVNNWSSISAAKVHTCGVHINGSAYCWGVGTDGELGYGGTSAAENLPLAVNFSPNNWTAIYASDEHTCGVVPNGSAYCWGNGSYGALGYGGNDSQFVPISVNKIPNNWSVLSQDDGEFFSCGILYNGTLYCWGEAGTSKRTGLNSMTDVFVPTQVVFDYSQPITEFDLKTVSVTNNETRIFGLLIDGDGLVDVSNGFEYYRIYLSTSSGGNSSSPEGNSLPFAYDYRVQVNGSVCYVYNVSFDNMSSCSFANSGGVLELSVSLEDLGASTGDVWNVSFETANSTARYDLAPDSASFVRFPLTGSFDFGVPLVSSVSVVPGIGVNGSVLNVSAVVTDDNTVSIVKAMLNYPNGSNFVNVSLDNTGGGSVYYNATYALDNLGVWGNLTATIYATDTGGYINQSESAQFIPYWNVSQNGSITLDGAVGDWSTLAKLSEPSSGDAASSYSLNWSYNWTSPENRHDIAYDVFEDSNGSVYVVGYGSNTSGNGNARDWLVQKLNSDNSLNWSYNWSSSAFQNDEAYGVAVDSNGFVYVAGYGKNVVGQGNTPDWVVQKLNSDGGLNWSYNWSSPGSNWDIVESVAVDSSGFVYAAGRGMNASGNGIAYDWLVQKLNVDGSLNWSYNWSSPGIQTDVANGVAVDSNGFVYVVGKAENASGNGPASDWLVQKLNSDGSLNWSYNWTSAWEFGDDEPYGVAVDDSGFVYVAGYGINASGSGNANDWLVQKLNSEGSLRWSYNWSTAGSNTDTAEGVAVNSSGFVYVVGNGFNASGSGNTNDWVVQKLSIGGTIDLKAVSVSNNDSYLFGLVEVGGSVDASGADDYYRMYISTTSSGNSTSPEGNSLPFPYDYRVQINGSTCYVYNTSFVNMSSCSFASSSSYLEFSFNFSDLGLSVNDTVNITFETANSTTDGFDLAPDYASFVKYTIKEVDLAATDDAPTTNLVSPSTATFDSDGNVIFNCTVTDNYGIANITLYGNWSGSWTKNITIDYGQNGVHWSTSDIGTVFNVKFADLNNDSIIDTLLSDATNSPPGERVMAYYFNGSSGWNYTSDRAKAFFIGDVDGDSDNDVFALDQRGFTILNNTGGLIDNDILNLPIVATLAVTDMDNDSVYDLLAIGDSSNRFVYVFNATTYDNWENVYNITFPDNTQDYPTELLFADIDGDGIKDELLVADSDNGLYVMNATDGTFIWNSTSSRRAKAMVLVDLNDDGDEEIVFGGQKWDDKQVFAYFKNYTQYWNISISLTQNWIYEIDTADLDNDGKTDELVIGTQDGDIYAYDETGSFMWNFTGPSNLMLSIAVGDLDNDGEDEIAAGGDDHVLYIIDRNGNSLWNYSTAGDIGADTFGFGAIDIADLNQDGVNDIAVADQDGYVYLITVPTNDTIASYNVAGLSDGNYVWNCLAYDNASQTDWANSNNTLTVDSSAPVINSKGINVSSADPGDTVCINASVTESLSSVDAVWATITQSNGTVTNTSEFSDTGDCAGVGSDGWYSVNVNVGTTGGTFYYNVTYVNNSVGLLGSDTTPASIAVDAAPNTNLVSPVNGAGQSSSVVRFVSNVTDGNNVVNATLYTNETTWSAKETRWNGEVAYNDTGLVLLMHFNNESAFGENDTVVFDWSGNGNNGTMGAGNEFINSAGRFGGSLKLDGVSDYVDVGNTSSLKINSSITMSAWFKFDELPSVLGRQGYIMGKGRSLSGSGVYGYSLVIHTDDDAYWDIYDSSGLRDYQPCNLPTLQKDVWYHIGVTWDGTNDANGKRCYLNGNSTDNNTVTIKNISMPDMNFYIGKDKVREDYDFNGSIDEVAVWNRSLSHAEMKALYNYTKTTYQPVFQNRTVADGNYVWNVLAYDNNSQSDWDTNNSLTVDASFPYFSNNATTGVYKKNTNYTANVTVNDNSLDYVWIESNHTGTMNNYSVTDISGMEYNFSTSLNISAGRGNKVCHRFFANDTAGNINNSGTYECFFVLNTAPTYDQSLTAQTVNVSDSSFVYDINCTEIDGDTLTYYDNTTLFDINTTSGVINHSLSESDAGSYNVQITCGDGYDNTSQTFTYTIYDNVVPTTVLVSPADTTITVLGGVMTTFNCSATDSYGLKNVSLYITDSDNQSFSFNSSSSLSGTSDWANWTYNMTIGNYTWNCLVYDTYNNSDWAVNRSYIVQRPVKHWNNTYLTNGKQPGVWNISTRATAKWFYTVSQVRARNFTLNSSPGNAAPTNPTPIINSSDGTNYSSQDLNCLATLDDDDNDTMNVSVRWFVGGILNITAHFNNSYANGTDFNATLGSGNTSAGQSWSCSMRVYDQNGSSDWGNSSYLLVKAEDVGPPNVSSLDYPGNDSLIFNLPIDFNFTVSDDVQLVNCSLFANFSQVWEINKTIYPPTNVEAMYNMTVSPPDGNYIWNVVCYDAASPPNLGWFGSNYTVEVDGAAPTWANQENDADWNTTTFDNITFNITFTDKTPDTYTLSIFDRICDAPGCFNEWTNYTGTYTSGEKISRVIQIRAKGGEVFKWRWYANDSAGRLLKTQYWFEYAHGAPPPPDEYNSTWDGENFTFYWENITNATQYRIYMFDDLNDDYWDYQNISGSTNTFMHENASQYERMFYKLACVNDEGETNTSVLMGNWRYTLEREPGGLNKNWISLPINNSDYERASDLLSALSYATAITYWNASTQQAVGCTLAYCPTSCEPTACDFYLKPGQAYEVDLNSTAPEQLNWTLNGIVFGRTNISLDRNVSGANWIAVPADTELNWSSDLVTSIGASKVVAVNKWNASTQASMGWVNLRGGRGINFPLIGREGYEVWVNDSVDWEQT